MDVESFPRVGGTEAGAYHEIATDVIVAYPSEGYVQTEAGARGSLREQHRIAVERGRRIVTVVLVDRVADQSASARRIWRDEVNPELVAGLCLVSSSLLSRAIASFFIGLSRPRVPTVMLATLEDAVAWARDQLATRPGGAT